MGTDLGIEDGVGGVHGRLVLSGVTDEALSLREGNVGGSRPVSLVVGDDLDTVVLPDTDARVRGAQVDTAERERAHTTGQPGCSPSSWAACATRPSPP